MPSTSDSRPAAETDAPPAGVDVRGLNLGIAQRPLGVLEILDSAMRLYRDNAKPMLTLGVVTVTVCVGATTALTLLVLEGLNLDRQTYLLYVSYFSLLSNAALSLAATAIAGVQTIAVARAFEGRPCTTGQAVKVMLARSPRIFGIWLLAKVLQSAGSSACGVPALFVTALFSITGPVTARERPSVGRWISRCMELIGRRIWWNLLLVTLVGVSSALLRYGLLAGAALLGIGGAFGVATATPTVLIFSDALSQILTGALVMPFVAATATVTYFDALVRFDGYDLVETARRLDPSSVTERPVD